MLSRRDLYKTFFFYLQGVECFDYNKKLNTLVTGSLDHTIKLWNPYVTSKPVALLQGHATGVIGVKVHEGLMQVFSYSKDAVSFFLFFLACVDFCQLLIDNLCKQFG